MNKTSIEKAKQLLEHQLKILWENPSLSCGIPPLMIWDYQVLESRLYQRYMQET